MASAVAAVLALGSAPEARAADPYKRMAREFSRGARHEAVERIAVLPFLPADASAPGDGWNISERLITRLVRRGQVKVIEREMLSKLMEEHSLAKTGMIDPASLRRLGKILSVDAVVTGSFVTLGRQVAVNARLILVETGVILAASEETLAREWFDSPAGRVEGASLADAVVTGAVLPAGTGGRVSCGGAAERLKALEESVLELKARHWAGRLGKGLPLAEFQAGPEASISDPGLRRKFVGLTRKFLAQRGAAPLSPRQVSRFILIDVLAFRLRQECEI